MWIIFEGDLLLFLKKIARDTTSYCSPRVDSGDIFFLVGNRPLGSFAGITAAIPAPVSEKKYYSAVYVCVWVSLCARLQQNSSVSLEFKFMDFKF